MLVEGREVTSSAYRPKEEWENRLGKIATLARLVNCFGLDAPLDVDYGSGPMLGDITAKYRSQSR